MIFYELYTNLEKGLLLSDLEFAAVGNGRAVPIEYLHLERYLGRVEAQKVNKIIFKKFCTRKQKRVFEIKAVHFKNHCPQKTTNTFTPPPPQNGHFFWGVNFFSERGLILS